MNELRRLLGRKVLVQVDGDMTFAGILALAGKRTLTLDGASALDGDRDVPMDGEVTFMLDRVLWVQAT